MKVSLKEINKYVDISSLNPNDIANRLTFAGIEVEEVKPFSTGTSLVIGQIIEIADHPDSDHLHVCKVDLGKKYGVKQIVCGAPNARLGLKVIVAMVGAKLANNIEIKDGVIRGVASSGMLCSLVELGVDEKYLKEEQIKGIEELSDDAVVGNENVLEYLSIDDTLLDLKLLANRSDCNALINVAREIATLYNLKFNDINVKNIKETIKNDVKVGSLTPKCQKFYSRLVKDVTVKESPTWLKNALNVMGVRSINNIVDIGNYVMLTTGQPLHMYDYDKLEVKELIVKDNLVKEFVALDEKTYDIIEGDLCVTSNDNIECLGGVMGSLHSETRSDSKNIVIEAAIFDSKAVRLTSNRLGLVSESSQRFNKGLNKFNQLDAINLATSLLIELADAKKVSNVNMYDELNATPVTLNCSYSYINKRLATNYSNKLIKDTLELAFIKVTDIDEDNFVANIPHHRIDITDRADLSEEVIRINGFDDMKIELPRTNISLGKMSEEMTKKSIISSYLVDNGGYECLTYSLVDKAHVETFTSLNKNEPVSVMNELTEDKKYLRNNLLLSLIDVASYNLNRKTDDFKIFEVSDIYSANYRKSHLAVVLSGYDLYQGKLNKIKYDFYYLKGIVESILKMFGIDKNRYSFQRVEEENEVFHFGKSAYLIIQGKKVGILGELHPSMIKKCDLPKNSNLQCLELILDNIYELRVGAIKSKEISKYQPISRDISFIADKNIEVGKILNEIKKCDKSIANVDIFDIYEGENVGLNKKSIAINVVFQSITASFKDEEINSMITKIKDMLVKKFAVELR